MITLEKAKELSYGTIIYYRHAINSDGTPQRWKVNGAPKTWKRSPQRIQVPLKHGLYSYGYLTERDLADFCLDEDEAKS